MVYKQYMTASVLEQIDFTNTFTARTIESIDDNLHGIRAFIGEELFEDMVIEARSKDILVIREPQDEDIPFYAEIYELDDRGFIRFSFLSAALDKFGNYLPNSLNLTQVMRRKFWDREHPTPPSSMTDGDNMRAMISYILDEGACYERCPTFMDDDADPYNCTCGYVLCKQHAEALQDSMRDTDRFDSYCEYCEEN